MRSFSISTPIQKLHFVEHPRYGKVYPIVTINPDKDWDRTARASTVALTGINALCLYSTLAVPLFKAAIAAFVSNPLFLGPSLAANYIMYQKYYVLFYGSRIQVTSMFLKPNGK